MKIDKFGEEVYTLQILKREIINNEYGLILQSSVDYMIQMHKAFDKVRKTKMLWYVREIMEPAFPLVIKYFVREVKACYKEKGLRRAERIKEIEESVIEFGEMFEAIVNSTNGADRILLLSAPLDIGIRNTAPKLCAYYSDFLNELTAVIKDDNEGEYAFLVYPSLKNEPEAHILFQTSEEHGKVCIIRIPQSRIADISYVHQVLLHEFFHILPSQLRLRESRADVLGRIMSSALAGKLVNPYFLCSEQDIQNAQNFLLSNFAEDYRKHFKDPKIGERDFYAKNVKSFLIALTKNCMGEIQNKSLEDYIKYLDVEKNWINYNEFRRWYERRQEFRDYVNYCSQALIYNADVESMCRFYLTLFREPISDLFSILVLEFSPIEYYSQLFCNGINSLGERELEDRDALFFRAFFVTECLYSGKVTEGIRNILPRQEELLRKWQNMESYKDLWNDQQPSLYLFIEKADLVCSWVDRNTVFNKIICNHNNITILKKNSFKAFEDSRNEQDDYEEIVKKEAVFPENNFWVSEYMVDQYIEYFVRCCQAFLNYEGENLNNFSKFKKRFGIDKKRNESDLFDLVSERKWKRSE